MISRDKIKININTADTASLIKITGISATSAKKIVEFCTESGPVKSEAELSRIPGLSKNIIRKIIPFLEFGSEDKPPLFGKFMRTSPGRLKFKIPQTDFQAEQANVSFAKTTLLDKHQRPLTSLTINYPVFKGDNSFVNFKIPLSRHNPPGSHKIEMIVNDVREEIVIDIEERVDVRIIPDQFYLENNPGESVEKDVYITNMGNMPLTLKDPGPVILESEFLECRMIRDFVHQIKSKKLPVEDLLGSLADKLGNLYEEAGSLKIRFAEPCILAPGEKVKMILKILLPKSLKPTQKYTGTFRLFNSAVTFKIQ